MQRITLLLTLSVLFVSVPALAGPVIDWNDVNDTLSGTPTLSPTNLSFTDVNGVVGLDLTITVGPSSIGGATNIQADSPKPFVDGGVSHVGNYLGNATANTGNALTFTFNQPVSFIVENTVFGNFGGGEQVIVSSTVPVTGSLINPQGPETATTGTNMITFAGNGSVGTTAKDVQWTAAGSMPATSFIVDYSRSDAFAGSFEPFSVSVTAVPEPSSFLFLGLLTVAGVAYRRRVNMAG